MKFKRGQLVTTLYGGGALCIVLGRIGDTKDWDIWYKVYMIEQQRASIAREHILSTINPQVSESEV